MTFFGPNLIPHQELRPTENEDPATAAAASLSHLHILGTLSFRPYSVHSTQMTAFVSDGHHPKERERLQAGSITTEPTAVSRGKAWESASLVGREIQVKVDTYISAQPDPALSRAEEALRNPDLSVKVPRR